MASSMKNSVFWTDAVKSDRILSTFPKNLLLQSEWPWRNVSKCDVTSQEGVLWVMISAQEEITTCCDNNLRITYHCHYAKKSTLSNQLDTQPWDASNDMPRFHLQSHLATLRTSYQPSDQPVYPPLRPRLAEREMDLVVYSIVNISCWRDNQDM
jgi:hypothetical protein